MRHLHLLLASLLGACVAGTAGPSGTAPEVDLDDPGRAETIRVGEDELLGRSEAPPPLPPDGEVDEEVDPLDENPLLAPIEEVLAEDGVLPPDDAIPAVGVAAPVPPTEPELAAMAREGIEHVRVFLACPDARGPADLPLEWIAAVDGLFADAARHRIRLLPVLICAEVPALDDASLTAWGDYAFHLSARYGETGDLWEERPELDPVPPRAWEVWSEPNHPSFWSDEVDPGHYRALLLYARVGLRDGDPSAKVIVGGLAPASSGAMDPAAFLDAVLETPDADQLFEGVGVHPFARDAGEALDVLSDVRGVLDGRGLSTAGIWITEAGWALREGGASRLDARDEADRIARVRALLDGVEREREALQIGPVFWASHRDLELAETGGVDGWSAHMGLFAVEGEGLAATELSRAFALRVASLPLTSRAAPGRTGPVRTASPLREARRDDGNRRLRRARKRHFRKTVMARMFQLGQCTRGDGDVQRMKPGCDPWTVPAADTWRVEQHPEWSLEDRRVHYVCSTLRQLRPTLVSGLVRFNRQHVLDGDPSLEAEIEREARMFRRVRHCVRQPGTNESRPRRVRFDVALNTLHYTHTQQGVTSAEQGRRWHLRVLEALDPMMRPDAWFYDFYADPYDQHRLCYGPSDDCRDEDQRFFVEGMDAGIRWAHRNGQWVGGHTFVGREIPPSTDYVVLTYATLAEPSPTDGFAALQRERSRIRAEHPDIPIIMHIRNDPQIEGSTGHLMFEGDGQVRDLLRRHYQRQEGIGYGYMTPAFFPLRYTDSREFPVESFDPLARGMVPFLRRQQRRFPARP